ncbi:MAG: hypothetical protein RDV41_10330, partial [Planctomycetota bacterium]|nr:hypothetical protein [Planctomycetota bacterium]
MNTKSGTTAAMSLYRSVKTGVEPLPFDMTPDPHKSARRVRGPQSKNSNRLSMLFLDSRTLQAAYGS